MTAPGIPAIERWEMKVERTATCWLWTASLSTNGYGQFTPYGRTVPAHRFSYETFVGPIPPRLEIDHLCGVRRCVNPDHLEPVTHHENMRRLTERRLASAVAA